MKQTPILLVLFLLLSLTLPASADVSLIFTEPLLKGNTEMRIFYASNSSLMGSITTNASEVILVDGESYILQVLPTGISFASDPFAGLDYIERGTVPIFTIGLGLLMLTCLAGILLYFFFSGQRRKPK